MKIKPIYNVMVVSNISGIILTSEWYDVDLSRPFYFDEDKFYFIHPVYNCECMAYKREFEF